MFNQINDDVITHVLINFTTIVDLVKLKYACYNKQCAKILNNITSSNNFVGNYKFFIDDLEMIVQNDKVNYSIA